MADLTDKLEATYERADRLSGGTLSLLRKTVDRFGKERAAQAAAGMAYYAFFSLFPLLLFLVAAGSFFLERGQVFRQAIDLVGNAIPNAQNLIERNLDMVLQLRGPVGLVGLVGALWSASGFFAILGYNLNLAWPGAEPRSFFEKRLVALGMVGVLAALLILLLILSLFSTSLLNLMSRLQVPILGTVSVYESPLWAIFSNLLPWLFSWLLFVGLYRWVPNTEVRWPAVLWSAFVAALAWQLAAEAFAWYLNSGLARYQLVYGSLGTVVALLFWIYVSSWIILFGAHLCATIDRRA
jgi:membrane protein